MKTIKQLLRQPIKMAAGLILVILASAILCVCVGQALAARQTADTLEHQFTSVAIPKAKVSLDNNVMEITNMALTEEVKSWLEEMRNYHPDVIQAVSNHGILSAFIPELTPMNYTQGPYIADNFGTRKRFWHFQPMPAGLPYSCAMLVITLEEIGQPQPQTQDFVLGKPKSLQDFPTYSAYFEWYNQQEKETVTKGYSLSLTGTVTEVVSLQEGYRDPTGMIARLTITVPALSDLESLGLVEGERYLVYGMDYYDEDWALRGYLADERHRNPVQIDSFDLSKLDYLTEEEILLFVQSNPYFIPAARYGSLLLTQLQCDQINAISMTLSLPIPMMTYEAIRDENGNLLQVRMNENVTYTDPNGETVTMDHTTYSSRYAIPTIARLSGTAAEFLASSDGAAWKQALERDAVNNQAFAVVGVDHLGYLADFAREKARITQGRGFTEDETSGGAQVCVIHEALAAANGLNVGDSITLNLYRGDEGLPYQQFRTDKRGLLMPAADFYFDTTSITQTATYTIVGFYRGPELWADVSENEYSFSPNTVFVPKSSVTMPMEYSDSILFTTVVIRNGKLEEFKTLVNAAGYTDLFLCYDQGYSEISKNFHNYEALSRQMLLVGMAAYGMLLLLFLLLYPAAQRKTVKTMQSLGAPFGKRMAFVVASALWILIPASLLGGLLGLSLWQKVVDELQASAEAAMALQIGEGTLGALSAIQLLFALVLTVAVASLVAKSVKMGKGGKK